MYFQKIKGHEYILDNFKRWIIQDNFEGVYLFQGQKGIGKYTTAKAVVKYLICNGVQDDSCICENCRLFPNIPDYLEISSDEESVIKVSDIEVIENFVTLKSFWGKKRVIIIDDAERLNSTTSSQLLKTLEDLPSHIVVFLISSYPEKLPPTITSRSIPIDFKPLHISHIIEILKEKGFDSKKTPEFNRMLPFLSKSVLANYSSYIAIINYVHEFLMDFGTKEEDELLSTIDYMDSEGNLVYFFEIFHIFMCDILRYYFDDRNTVFNSNNTQLFDKLSLDWKRDVCFVALEKIKPVILDYKKGVNIKLRSRVKAIVSWLYLKMKKDKLEQTQKVAENVG